MIDMQRDSVEAGGFGEALGNDVSLVRTAIAPCTEVLAAARQKGIMVIHTREGHRADSVSYTHLDVYKRQCKTRSIRVCQC